MPEGILNDLHQDHEEVSGLIEQMIKTEDGKERGTIFKEMMSKLLAHSHAEQNVLYKKMEKSENEKSRSFAFEGENEHQIVEQQLQQMARARNKASEQWTAQATVLKELVDTMSGKRKAPASAARAASSTARRSRRWPTSSVSRSKSCCRKPETRRRRPGLGALLAFGSAVSPT